MMVGRETALAYPPRAASLGPTRLAVEGLTAPGLFADVSFEVRAGEVLGLGGIQGNGQADVVRALFGLVRRSGTVSLDGTAPDLSSPARAMKAGIVYVPGDRHGEGLFMPHSIRENVSLPHLKDWAGLGLLPREREEAATREAIRRFAVKTTSPERGVATLSGGNQQKVVLGRWTAGAPRLFIFEDPTRGVDVATKLDIYHHIRALADEGAAVILVSSDLLELIGLSDRILVFARGRIVDEVAAAEASEQRIVGSAVDAGRSVAAAPSAPGAPAASDAPKRVAGGGLVRRYTGSVLLALLILVLAAGTARYSDHFLAARNLSNIAAQVAPLALVALGQFCVVLLGGIDLSVGPLISLITAICSFLAVAEGGMGIAAASGAALAAGLAIGLLNALLVVRLRLPDLIATLSTYSIVLGLALIVRPSPGGLVSESFSDALSASWGPVPIAALLVVLLFAAAEILLLRGRIGQRLYGVGSNSEASQAMGIDSGIVRTGAYVFCALCASLAGLLVAARIGSGDPQAGASFTLASVTAVVVGGASVFGGRGTAVGVLLGAVAVGVMQNALNLMQVSAYYQYVWTGGLTLLAVGGYALQRGAKGRLMR